MKLSFASRAAAHRLGLIILSLLIPAIFFGGAFIRQSLNEITFLKTELKGLELAALTIPAIEKNNLAEFSSHLEAIKKLESELGVDAEHDFVSHFSSDKGENASDATDEKHDHAKGNFVGYMADIASQSGVILDSDAESYHLANMLLIALPAVWKDAVDFEEMFKGTTPRLSTRAKLAATAGNLLGAFNRQGDSFQRALKAKLHMGEYAILTSRMNTLDGEITKLMTLVTGPETVLNQDEMVEITSNIRKNAKEMVGPSFSTLRSKMQSRINQASQILYLISGVGIAVAIFAMYLALRMMFTTFRKLDAVEEAHRVSEEMRLETDRINGEVAELNRNLADSLDKLQNAQNELLNKGKMEQLGQLTATVAHEIRNPLGAVRTSAFLIGRKLEGKNTGVETQLQRIATGIQRCDAIITQLLDFSRTKKVLTEAAVLDDWLETVLTEDCEALPATVAVECQLGVGGTKVDFDGPRLRRAIVNLMTNACEAMVGKGTAVSSTLVQNPKVCVATRLENGEVYIDVSDNGPGMAPDVLNRIREPLFTTKNFGTGLGVPAVEQIAIQHGGRLDIQSQPGVGSKFTIVLPLTSDSEKVAA